MARIKTNRFFGVGPLGLLISLVALVLVWGLDQWFGHPQIASDKIWLLPFGILLMAVGLGIHLWAGWTLRHWWIENRLCTEGPFRYLRHPMYAAWITFISTGISLLMNSWIFLAWPVFLHPIWHRLVVREEEMMEALFGEDYKAYSARTGRFFPRLREGLKA